MEHSYASEHRFVEQYLLDELPPAVRDEFEEHFFDCRECSAELRLTSEFLATARLELQRPEFATAAASPGAVRAPGAARWVRNALGGWLSWRGPFAGAALAACLLVLVYQNVVTLPRLRSDVARAEAPAVIPVISLVGGNSRGGNVPSANVSGAKSVLLQLDIPTLDGVSTYSCSLYSPDHRLIWSVDVTAEEAKDTVFLRAPLVRAESGTYTLAVQAKNSNGAKVDVVKYQVNLNIGATQSGH